MYMFFYQSKILSSFMTYHRIFITTGVASGTGTCVIQFALKF